MGALRLAASTSFFYGDAATPTQRSDERGIAFSADGTRAYVVSREPSELIVVDTSDSPTGAPVNEVIGSIEICAQASSIALVDFGTGPSAWLPCFATGQVWVVDVERLRLEAVIDAGRGPNALAADTGRNRVYVANYAEDTITVIDADPVSETRYAPVKRLGKQRRPE